MATFVVTAHPAKQEWAEGYAAAMPVDEDDEVLVVTSEDVPPGKVYVTSDPPEAAVDKLALSPE